MGSALTIRHRPEDHRWEAVAEDGAIAGYLSYRREGEVLDLRHTVVDPAYRGQGIAGDLVSTAFAHIRSEGLRARPTCSYVERYVAEHPELSDLVAV